MVSYRLQLFAILTHLWFRNLLPKRSEWNDLSDVKKRRDFLDLADTELLDLAHCGTACGTRVRVHQGTMAPGFKSARRHKFNAMALGRSLPLRQTYHTGLLWEQN